MRPLMLLSAFVFDFSKWALRKKSLRKSEGEMKRVRGYGTQKQIKNVLRMRPNK